MKAEPTNNFQEQIWRTSYCSQWTSEPENKATYCFHRNTTRRHLWLPRLTQIRANVSGNNHHNSLVEIPIILRVIRKKVGTRDENLLSHKILNFCQMLPIQMFETFVPQVEFEGLISVLIIRNLNGSFPAVLTSYVVHLALKPSQKSIESSWQEMTFSESGSKCW